jgi:predicted DCC family thiol-disulfide oxidoreductase YuxK
MALVIFFDGECGFCSKSVRRVYQLDPDGAIEFAPLQGILAGKLGLRKYAEKDGGSMVILRESDGEMFFKGDAWVVLGEALGGVWAVLASAFSIFPKHTRDWAYDLVAKNRYRIAGKGNHCAVPEEGLRKRIRP